MTAYAEKLDTEKLLKRLVRIWNMTLVNHKKEKDCHWYITTDYAHNGTVTYTVEHNGYISKDIYRVFTKKRFAEKFLIEILIDTIKDEIKTWLALIRKNDCIEYSFGELSLEEAREYYIKLYKRVILIERYYTEWK